EELSQVGVEIYGGPLLNSWLDRELRLAGLLTLTGGRRALVATPPVLRVPQLAVHLDRAVNKDGLQLDPQRHMQPIVGIGEVDVRALLAAHADPLDESGHPATDDTPLDPIDPDDIVGFDVVTVDAQAPALFGADEEFLASARLDNLSSVHAETQALITVAGSERGEGAPIALLVANDHEEVGSASRSGAAGPSSRTCWCGCMPRSAGTTPRAGAPSPPRWCSRPTPATPPTPTIPSGTIPSPGPAWARARC